MPVREPEQPLEGVDRRTGGLIGVEPRRHRSLRAAGKTVLLALALALCTRVGFAQAYRVDGPSMEPSLVHAQRLLVLRAAYGLSLPGRADALLTWGVPAVGDVVILRSPVDGLDLVKRVVGVPGDVVDVRAGIVYRNGRALEQRDVGPCDPDRQLRRDRSCRVIVERVGTRSWRTARSSVATRLQMIPVRVPAGQVFVLGDHRDRSNDSRSFGPVPVERLRGRVLLVD